MVNAVNITGGQNGNIINRKCFIQIIEKVYFVIHRSKKRFIRMMVNMNRWSCIICKKVVIIFQ